MTVIVDNSYLDAFEQANSDLPTVEAPEVVRATRSRSRSLNPAHDPERPLTVRRWESGKTNRLNEGHWTHATGQPINVDLASYLKTLRQRCCYEAANNPIVEGVIRTHTIDLFGPSGPTLKVVSDSEDYNRSLEGIWRTWWTDPTSSGGMDGRELLDLWNTTTWKKGAVLGQLISDRTFTTSDNPIALRIMPIDPDRLETPVQRAGDRDIALGIKRDRYGRPLEYYVSDPDSFGVFEYWTGKFKTLQADDVIHEFLSTEAGQVTGFPRLSSCLQEIADLREYDQEVLFAARSAARHSPYWYTRQPEAWHDAGGIYPGDEIEIEPGTERFAPPGWEPAFAPANQPAIQYVSYRHEKLRALGRVAHMPLLLVLLSAEQSNFSQSRIDVNVFYERGLASERSRLWSRILSRLVGLVAREAMLVKDRRGNFILPKKPDRVRFEWGWDPLPQADPLKAANADEARIRQGITTTDRIIAREGEDPEEIAIERARINERNKGLGLPEIPGLEDKNAETETEGTTI